MWVYGASFLTCNLFKHCSENFRSIIYWICSLYLLFQYYDVLFYTHIVKRLQKALGTAVSAAGAGQALSSALLLPFSSHDLTSFSGLNCPSGGPLHLIKTRLDIRLTERAFLFAVRVSFMLLNARSHSLGETAMVRTAFSRGSMAAGVRDALISLYSRKPLGLIYNRCVRTKRGVREFLRQGCECDL